jgi:hypothetical protein
LRRGGGDGFSLSPLVPPPAGQTIAAASIAPRKCCHRFHAPSKDVDAVISDDVAPPPARRNGCGDDPSHTNLQQLSGGRQITPVRFDNSKDVDATCGRDVRAAGPTNNLRLAAPSMT